MLDSNMALPSRPDIDRYPERKMSTKTGSDFDFRLSFDVGPCLAQCQYCLKVVGLSGKCVVCRWDFADISFHSRDPVYFRFTVRDLEFRMIQASDNVDNGTAESSESGVVENRG